MSRPLSSPLRQMCTACRRTQLSQQFPAPNTPSPGKPTFKRHKSTTKRPAPAKSAAEAALSLLETFKDVTRKETQILDGNQLRKLSLTLGRRELHPRLDISTRAPGVGTVVPPGYHLVYFTPGETEDNLGEDGSDLTFNAPYPFTRRMWAGGRMKWMNSSEGDGVALRVGDEVEERTRLLNATPKMSRSGDGMVLVEVEKEFWGPRGLALVDERSWIFRPKPKSGEEMPEAKKSLRKAVIQGPSTVKDVPQNGGYPLRHLRWSPTGLFRFSALTFNGHKIHYDPTWTTVVERHPACVVHGPLNLISMLDYWRDHCASGGRKVQAIDYRAEAPVYAGETYEISAGGAEEMAGSDGSVWEVLVTKKFKTCMKANIWG
ncbi:hypothetical protein F5Y10DRAFT_201387 [Nemania abortiva]|nr:hypothetical protein F5Y10DRAFT_201387 [Nemania abortiva]